MPRLFLLPTVRAYRTLLPPTEGAVRKHIGILALECLHSGWYFKFVARVFMSMHRQLLDCYATTNVDHYKNMDIVTQRDFCLKERSRLEESLIRGHITAKDFFAPLKAAL